MRVADFVVVPVGGTYPPIPPGVDLDRPARGTVVAKARYFRDGHKYGAVQVVPRGDLRALAADLAESIGVDVEFTTVDRRGLDQEWRRVKPSPRARGVHRYTG